jgi:outer membrane protein TolC
MSRPVCALLLLLSALPAADAGVPLFPAYARRFRGPDLRVRDIEGIDERIRDGKLHLRLKDFLELVLKNNTEIQIMRLEVLPAADAVLAAKAVFDPSVWLGFSGVRSTTPSYSQISGAQSLSSLNYQTQIGASQMLPSGQSVSAGFSGTRLSDNSQFDFFNPSISSGLTFSLTQPLLQNRGNIQNLAPLRNARTQLLIASDQAATRIADAVVSAAGRYWDAIQARDSIRVAQLAVDLAQKSYDRDKLALDLGALSKLDIYQSQSQVAQRKVDLIGAQYAFRDALDGLRRLIGADLNPATRNLEMVLEDDPSSLPPEAVGPADEAIQSALARRPEIAAIDRSGVIDDLNARVARDTMLPRLDLTVQAGGNGLGGNQVPTVSALGGTPVYIPGGLGDALSQMLRFNAPFYGLSLQMTLPVRSSRAEASLADALVSRAEHRYLRRQTEQQVIQEVKAALNQLEMAKAQIEAATLARDLARQNVDAQQQKYEIGGITVFELLDAQSRLASVENALVAGYAGYQKSLIAYQRATWTLLDGFGIVVETPKVR